DVSCRITEDVEGEISMVVNDDGQGGRTTVECNSENNSDTARIALCHYGPGWAHRAPHALPTSERYLGSMDANYETLTVELRGHLRLIGLNRPEKLNAFNLTMLRELGLALKAVEDDADARVAILFPHGESLTAGLDLAEVGPHVRAGGALFED